MYNLKLDFGPTMLHKQWALSQNFVYLIWEQLTFKFRFMLYRVLLS